MNTQAKKNKIGHSLATLNPELAKEWHPTKNGSLTPYDVTLGSGKRVWWKCPKGDDHEWEAYVYLRVSGLGCPICSNQKVVLSNCLATLNPVLAEEWHPNKNGNLTPYEVGPGSGKKVWWKCPKGDDHEWKAPVRVRHEGTGCGVCANKVVVKSNCLATRNPELAKEWHSTKNGELTPHDVAFGSHKKVWWKCPVDEDHEWKAAVKDRNNGRGCGICAGKIVVKSNCLATLNPEVAKEWHLTKNGNLTPEEVTCSSNKKVWWKCPKGDDHEWEAIISDRNRGDSCPVCANQKVVLSNCLATLNPELAKEWHPVKNKNLSPYDVTPGSNIKVWWKCTKGDDHEWETTPNHRAIGTGCPVCSNIKVVKSNCLETINPQLAKEWHPTKNGNLTPYDVGPGSNEKVWWKCPEGEDHQWETSVNARNSGHGCPYCSGRNASKSNNLALSNPEFAKQWHPTKNGNLSPTDVTCSSQKKVWWKCPEGDDHEWKTAISNRANGTGCPFCSNRKVTISNCLATLNPVLAKEWHPTKNGSLTPYDVTLGSGEKVWWKCPYGDDHEWEATVSYRNREIGCPICSKRIVVPSNCLATLNPELVKEWHPTKNGSLTPYDVTPGSREKVWWKCSKGKDHVWRTSLYHRTNKRTGCPFCKNPSSAPELRILCELKTIFPSTQHRVYLKGHEVDILIPELKIGIEYDGEFWHRKKKKQDLEKNHALKDEILLIRVREKGLPILSESDIEVKTREFTITTVKELLQFILDTRRIMSLSIVEKIKSYKKNRTWIASEAFQKLHAERNHIDFKESIAHLHPEITEQWHSTKNDPLLPEYFSPGSNVKVWWKCPKGVDHEWESTIVNRAQLGRGCPVCSGRLVKRSNCLATLNPELAKEWHPSKNNKLTPYDVGPGSQKKVWWKCPRGHDHEWEANVASRNNGVGCPICSNKKTVKSNSLATLNPELAKEWHPTKNGDLTPDNVTCGSHKKVWWKCPVSDDHEWEATIKSRNSGNGCSICANKTVVSSNSLATLKPKLTKEWHPIKNGQLSPSNVHPGSSVKVWWKGECGHEWQAVVAKRANRGDGCPKCKGKRISQTRRNKNKSPGQLDLFN